MAVPFGKYQLLRKIASGGMGQVFLALERGAGLERLVVLKLILPHLAEDVWAMAGGAGLAVDAPWPKADPALLQSDAVTLPIQINGKRRGEITVPESEGAK